MRLAAVSESADGLIKQAQGELQGISSDDRVLLGNLNAMTGESNQKKIQTTLDHAHRLLWSNAVTSSGSVSRRDVPTVVIEMNHTLEGAIDKLLAPLPASTAQ